MFVFWYRRDHKELRERFTLKISQESQALLNAPEPINEAGGRALLRRQDLFFKAKAFLASHDQLAHFCNEQFTRLHLVPMLAAMLAAWENDALEGDEYFRYKMAVHRSVQFVRHRFDAEAVSAKFTAGTNAVFFSLLATAAALTAYMGVIICAAALNTLIPMGFIALGIGMLVLGIFATIIALETAYHNCRTLCDGQVKDIQHFADALVGEADYRPVFAADKHNEGVGHGFVHR